VILLDTHVVFWMASKPERLSRPAQRRIATAASRDGLAISSISLWELALLIARGRISVAGSTEGFLKELCQRAGLIVLDITPDIAALAFHVPQDFPNDLADRLISATARAHGLKLVTKDRYLQDSPLLRTIW
jgi:PIN domain nuclease of toxin-antitoxin system